LVIALDPEALDPYLGRARPAGGAKPWRGQHPERAGPRAEAQGQREAAQLAVHYDPRASAPRLDGEFGNRLFLKVLRVLQPAEKRLYRQFE